jgi:hypothetical protein
MDSRECLLEFLIVLLVFCQFREEFKARPNNNFGNNFQGLAPLHFSGDVQRWVLKVNHEKTNTFFWYQLITTVHDKHMMDKKVKGSPLGMNSNALSPTWPSTEKFLIASGLPSIVETLVQFSMFLPGDVIRASAPNSLDHIQFFVIHILLWFFKIILLFICAYKAWVISPPCPHPLPYHPLCLLPLPPPPQDPAETILPLFLILL